jgi:hypothetical protein
MIKNLIAQNRILDAINAIPDTDASIILSSQWHNLQRQINMGVISNQEASMFQNRIINSVMQFAGGSQNSNPAIEIKQVHAVTLISIVSENRRRRPQVADDAQAILNELRAYGDEKAINPAFDPAGRRLRAIQEKERKFIEDYQDAKELSLEVIVEKITTHLSAPVPNYDDLSAAYTLAGGRGMKNNWIEDQLQRRPKDDDTQITIAEKIEAFAATIVVK